MMMKIFSHADGRVVSQAIHRPIRSTYNRCPVASAHHTSSFIDGTSSIELCCGVPTNAYLAEIVEYRYQ